MKHLFQVGVCGIKNLQKTGVKFFTKNLGERVKFRFVFKNLSLW